MSRINWHRVFGLTLIDFFLDSEYEVILEKELTAKKQFLDIAIIKRKEGKAITELPEGLEELAAHNLITYKSMQESLNTWAIDELIGHYVNYRKQESQSLHHLIPVEKIKLFAMCTRYPKSLEQSGLKLEQQQNAVFNLTYGSHQIKVLVLSKMPKAQRNAIWQLFSGTGEGFVYGGQNYNWHSRQDKAILNQLYEFYKQKGAVMPYTMDDFVRDYVSENLHVLSADEVLKRYSPDEVLGHYSPDEVLKQYSSDEVLKHYSPDEVLKQYSPETIKAFLEKLEKKG
ncbi:hypothetical protein [Thioflexithrix psekupsensis]|uniref:Uncharacterized protein n=1 Tax=Thioflexithrix psekupsensis TaxID=1570016 RepID=A0A251X642_9GAMM|nr:hypothetical protein [Thioflexithrix psekupsensis]OUD12612.1 hypothetical protein TPSD3_16150 [Thioflexithrix psekupsensis]